MASFPSGLSFRVLLHDSREISRRHRRKRKYSSSSIKSCVYSRMFSWLRILASNEKRRFNPKIWKTEEIILLRSRNSPCLSKMYLIILQRQNGKWLTMFGNEKWNTSQWNIHKDKISSAYCVRGFGSARHMTPIHGNIN